MYLHLSHWMYTIMYAGFGEGWTYGDNSILSLQLESPFNNKSIGSTIVVRMTQFSCSVRWIQRHKSTFVGPGITRGGHIWPQSTLDELSNRLETKEGCSGPLRGLESSKPLAAQAEEKANLCTIRLRWWHDVQGQMPRLESTKMALCGRISWLLLLLFIPIGYWALYAFYSLTAPSSE